MPADLPSALSFPETHTLASHSHFGISLTGNHPPALRVINGLPYIISAAAGELPIPQSAGHTVLPHATAIDVNAKKSGCSVNSRWSFNATTPHQVKTPPMSVTRANVTGINYATCFRTEQRSIMPRTVKAPLPPYSQRCDKAHPPCFRQLIMPVYDAATLPWHSR